ncbi:MAG: cytosine permease [Firmicutes bacterium]|jgi:purine-cytosine permease-like protein|nr:cytosine permease [Bacillota bacterium]
MAIREVAVEQDKAFRVETHGIDIIPDQQRHGSPRDLFWVWIAGNLTFGEFVIGDLFIQMGLSLWEALAIDLFCALAYVVLGWMSLAGPKTGTATLTISRAIFGIKGNRLPALFSWMDTVGWEAVNTVLTVFALVELFGVMGLPHHGVGVSIAALAISLLLTYIVPILGHQTVVVMQRILAYGLALLSIGLFFVVLPHVPWNYAASRHPWAANNTLTFIFGLSVGIMSTVLSWTNYGSDYSRYLPKHASGKAVVGYTWLGSGIAAIVMLGLGSIVGTLVNSHAYAANPVTAIMQILPGWYEVPFLLVVIAGLVTGNYLNSYSSAMSFLAMGAKIHRFTSALLDSGIAVAITLYALFLAPAFLSFFQNFLDLAVLVIGPWTGMFLAHYFAAKGEYDAPSLVMETSQSQYWFQGGMNWPAIFIFLLSGIMAFWFVDSTLWVSPISKNLLGGMDLSAFVGPILGFVLYWQWYHGRRAKQSVSIESWQEVKEEGEA